MSRQEIFLRDVAQEAPSERLRDVGRLYTTFTYIVCQAAVMDNYLKYCIYIKIKYLLTFQEKNF